MRYLRLLSVMLICLLAVFAAVSCDKTTPADDTTTPASTEAPTDPATEALSEDVTETPTEVSTDPVTEEITEAPAEVTTEEETTVEETTEPFTPPTADPAEASAAGLPLDGDGYTVGGESPAVAPADQYAYLSVYAHAYEGKSFTLYGNLLEDASGNLTISLGDDMGLVVYFPNSNPPTVGSYVKVTAAFEKTVDRGEYVDFGCFTMMVSACEVLGEAKGPNGGRLMYITASSLNVRTSSDTSSSNNIIGTYSKGDLVEVFEQDAKGWYRVNYNGQTAYISNKYVSETKP